MCIENRSRKEGRESEETGQSNSWKESNGTRIIRIPMKYWQCDSTNPNKDRQFIISLKIWLYIVPRENTRGKKDLQLDSTASDQKISQSRWV